MNIEEFLENNPINESLLLNVWTQKDSPMMKLALDFAGDVWSRPAQVRELLCISITGPSTVDQLGVFRREWWSEIMSLRKTRPVVIQSALIYKGQCDSRLIISMQPGGKTVIPFIESTVETMTVVGTVEKGGTVLYSNEKTRDKIDLWNPFKF